MSEESRSERRLATRCWDWTSASRMGPWEHEEAEADLASALLAEGRDEDLNVNLLLLVLLELLDFLFESNVGGRRAVISGITGGGGQTDDMWQLSI